MFYTISEGHGLPHDPLKALIAPRPIAWVGTRNQNSDNLAAYSFFAQLSMTQIGFSVSGDPRTEGIKDTLANIRKNTEFSISLPSLENAQHVANSGAGLPYGVDEFAHFNIPKAECRLINAPYVKDVRAALECRLDREIDLGSNTLVIGEILAIHISDEIMTDGLVDSTKMKNLSRLGYFDYASIDKVFAHKTPKI